MNTSQRSDKAPPEVRESGSPAVVMVIATIGGLLISFTLFALSFTRSHELYLREAIIALLLFASGAALLGVLWPRRWVSTAIALTLPMILFASYFCYLVLAQGSGLELAYLLQVGSVAVAAFGGTALGKLLKRADKYLSVTD